MSNSKKPVSIEKRRKRTPKRAKIVSVAKVNCRFLDCSIGLQLLGPERGEQYYNYLSLRQAPPELLAQAS